jgi:hypothetical protein
VGEAAQLGLNGVEMISDLMEALSKRWRQLDDRFIQGQVHGGQELTRLVVELTGNAAALGLLGLQKLVREALQPLTPGLHFGVELGIAKGGGGLVREEPP